MKKCVIVDLFDSSPHNTSYVLAKHCTWMRPPQDLPKPRQRNLAYYNSKSSHSEQIEQLNAMDKVILKLALK